jgi:hypothetical protein
MAARQSAWSGCCGSIFCSNGSICRIRWWKKRFTIRRLCGVLLASTSAASRCRTRRQRAASATCEARKGLLREVLAQLSCPRVVYVDHIVGRGAELLRHVEAIGAEGIVSKRAGSLYNGGESRDWQKTKCHRTGRFVVTGFQELGPGRLEALHVSEDRNGELVAAGQVRFGFAGKGLWAIMDQLRAGSPGRYGIVPIEPWLAIKVKYFGRHKGAAIRDGVLIALIDPPQPQPASVEVLRYRRCNCSDGRHRSRMKPSRCQITRGPTAAAAFGLITCCK